MSSSQVDEKVVSLVFNNANFEKNVKTSLSTLDKLKSSLQFKKVPDGIKNIGSAIGKVSFSPLNRGIQEVHAKFSALEVVGVTALSNITNSAVNAGKKIASAITIDPVKSGFQEYETQINAIQTILANTKSKGTTLDDVNAALDELNKYADMTIYNFTEMTRNIGTFTAAGVDLDTSVAAIKGIANLAAVSGSNSQQASTAMYQLSQALAAGTVKLMDWNSVVNAGMGGELFQESLKETARLHGVAIDQMIADEGSFRETLKDGWLTSQVLTETLAKFTGDLSAEQLKNIGYTDEQAASILELGEMANGAATEVKTFTQLFDTLAEALQSGWTNTWELIIGDFEEAKGMLSGISNFLNDIIESSSNARNEVLEGAITPWKSLEKQITNAGIGMDDFRKVSSYVLQKHELDLESLISKYGSFENTFQSGWLTGDIFKEIMDTFAGDAEGAEEAVTSAAHSVEEYQELVDSIIRGDWDNGQTRWDALTEAGWDWQLVQDMVNDQVWNGAINWDRLSDAELTNMGYTEEQIKTFRELGAAALDANSEVGQAVEEAQQKPGRELITETVTKSLEILQHILDTIGGSFEKAFGTIDSGNIHDILVGIHDFVTDLADNESLWDALETFFTGFFDVLKLGVDIVWGLGEAFLNFIDGVGKALNFKPLAIFGLIGTQLSNLVTWFRNSSLLKAIITFGDLVGSIFIGVVQSITDFINVVTKSEDGTSFFEYWSDVISNVSGIFGRFFKTLTVIFIIMKNNFNKLLEEGLTPESFINFITSLFSAIGSLLGITGNELVEALKKPFEDVANFIQNFVSDIDKYLLSLDVIGPIYRVLKEEVLGFFEALSSDQQVSGVINSISSLFEAFTNIPSGISTAFSTFCDNIRKLGDDLTFDQLIVEVQKFIDAVIEIIPGLSQVISFVSGAFTVISTLVSNMFSIFSNIGGYITAGLEKGIEGNSVLSTIAALATNIITTVCSILGIASPSKVMIAIGGFIILGLIQGLVSNAGGLVPALGNITDTIINTLAQLVPSGEAIGQNIGNLLIGITKNISDLIRGIAIGIAGSFANLSSALGPVGEMIGTFFSNVFNVLSALPIEAILVTVVLLKFTNVLGLFGEAVEGIGSAIGAIGTAMKAKKYSEMAKVVRSIAFALIAFTASAYILAQLPTDSLIQAGIAVGAFAAGLLILSVAMLGLSVLANKIAKSEGELSNFPVGAIISMAIGIMALSAAFYVIGKVNANESSNLGDNLIAFGAIMAAFLIAVLVLQGILIKAEPVIARVKVSLFSVSVSILILISAMALLNKMFSSADSNDTSGMDRFAESFRQLAALLLLITSLGIALGQNAKGLHNLGFALLSIGASLLIVVAAMKLLSTFDSPEELGLAAGVVAGILVVMLAGIGVLSIALKKFNAEIPKFTDTLVGLGVSFLAFAAAMKLMSNMSWDQLLVGLVGFVGLMVGLYVVIKALSNKVTVIKGTAETLIGVALAMSILIIAVKAFGAMDPSTLGQGVTIVSALMIIMALMMRLANLGRRQKPGDFKNFGIAIGILAAATIALSLLPDSGKVMIAAGSLAALVIAFGIMMKLSSANSIKFNWKNLLASIGMLVAVAGSIILVSSVIGDNVEAVITACVGIAAIIAAMALAMKLSKDVDSKDAASLLIASGAVFVAAMSVLLLGQLDFDQSLVAIFGLAAVVAAMGAVMAAAKGSKLEDLAGLAVGVAAIVAAAGALYILSAFPLSEDILQSAIALSLVIAAMGLCVKLCEGINWAGIAAMGVGVLLIGAVAASLYVLAQFDFDKILAAALALTATIVVLGLAVAALGALGPVSTTGALALIAIAGAMVIMAGAVAILAAALQILTAIDPELIANSLSKLAEGFATLGANAGFGILAAVAIIALGAAAAVVGLGLIVFAAGIGIASVAIGAFMEALQALVNFLEGATPEISSQMGNMGQSIGGFLILGLIAGMTALAFGAGGPIAIAAAIGTAILGTLCSVLGIASPSKEGFSIGRFIVEGVINGMKSMGGSLPGPVKNIGETIINTLAGETIPQAGEIGEMITSSFEDGMDIDSIVEKLTGQFDLESIFGNTDIMASLGDQFDLGSFGGRQMTSKFNNLKNHLQLTDQEKNSILNSNEAFSKDWAESLMSGTEGLDFDVESLYSGIDNLDLSAYGLNLEANAEVSATSGEEAGQQYGQSYVTAVGQLLQAGLENGWFTEQEFAQALGIIYEEDMPRDEFIAQVLADFDASEISMGIDFAIGEEGFVGRTLLDTVYQALDENKLDPTQAAEALGLGKIGDITVDTLKETIESEYQAGKISDDQLLSTLDAAGLFTGITDAFEQAAADSAAVLDQYRQAAAATWTEGIYGDGAERVAKLQEAGLNADAVQAVINAMEGLNEVEMQAMSDEEIAAIVAPYNVLGQVIDDDVEKITILQQKIDDFNKRRELKGTITETSEQSLDESNLLTNQQKLEKAQEDLDNYRKSLELEKDISLPALSSEATTGQPFKRDNVTDEELQQWQAYEQAVEAAKQAVEEERQVSAEATAQRVAEENKSLADAQQEYADYIETLKATYGQDFTIADLDTAQLEQYYKLLDKISELKLSKNISDAEQAVDDYQKKILEDTGTSDWISAQSKMTDAQREEYSKLTESIYDAKKALDEWKEASSTREENRQESYKNTTAASNRDAYLDASKETQSATEEATNAAVAAMQKGKEAALTVAKETTEELGTEGGNGSQAYATGLSSNTDKVSTASKGLKTVAKSGVSGMYSDGYTSGANMGQGMIDGLNSKYEPLMTASRTMANDSSNEAKKALDEHSPSKVWHKIGSYAGEGLTLGLLSQTSNVMSSAQELAGTATDGVSNLMSKLDFSTIKDEAKSAFAEALQPLNNIDLSSLDNNPVIRPVLDLTELESKASTIGSMFENQTLSVGGLSDLGSSIGKNQNGSEILSALNDLKKTLGTPVTNSYTINGITYDDGSNITSAIETLVHAAVVEGRM